jgi:hypothetical protein
MKIIGGYQNTKTNNEDFAITPYLFAVYYSGESIKVIGLGLCWGFSSVYIGTGFGIPKGYRNFYNHNKK